MRSLIAAALLAASANAAAATDKLDQTPAAQALPALTQRLYDALAPGDQAPWQHYLSARFQQTDESGARMDKTALLADFKPLPAGLSGSIAVEHAQVADFGAFALIRYDLDEREQVFDQSLRVRYRATDAWRREQGRWRLVSSQIMVVAQDPPPLPADPKLLDGDVGSYALGQWRYRVERSGDSLSLGREGRAAQRLIAVADNVFVAAGDPLAIQYIFVRGTDGRVQRIVERRKFADLELLRQTDAAP